MSTDTAQGISDTPYAKRTRELIKLVTQLRGVGAQVRPLDLAYLSRLLT